MINVSIIGSTGYAGEELTKLLLKHPEVNIKHICSHSYEGQRYSDVYPSFFKILDKKLENLSIKECSKDSDVIFIALPHGIASKEVTEEILKDTVIIDLGADFRLNDKSIYEEWYQVEHLGEELLKQAVYGLVEINKEEIKNKNLIANPGCYTTTSILALAPLCKHNLIDLDTIIIDAASGVTGAGRSAKIDNLFCEVDENFKAYGVTNHRHTPEIEQELSKLASKKIKLNFTPHLIPMERGILATCYADLKENITLDDVNKAYNSEYANQYFIRLRSDLPQTKFVKGSNYLDIGYKIDSRTNRIIVVAALDNLVKGAAGQAIQNMNIRFNIDESTGIDMIPDCLI